MHPPLTRSSSLGVLTVLGRPSSNDVTVTARGDIDLNTAARLSETLAMYALTQRVVLDMSRVGFCAVAGAWVISAAAESRRDAGARLVLVESHAVRRVLLAAGLAANVPRVQRLVDVPR